MVIIELGRPAFPDAITYFTSTYETAVVKPPDPPLRDPFAFTLSCIKRVETETGSPCHPSNSSSQEFQRGEKFPSKSQHFFFVVLQKIQSTGKFCPFSIAEDILSHCSGIVFCVLASAKVDRFVASRTNSVRLLLLMLR